MSSPSSASAVLDRVYLEIRCKLLDVAASLDRVARAEGGSGAQFDPRLAEIKQGIDILKGDGTDRAERIQMLFSDAYVPGWNRRKEAGANGVKRGARRDRRRD
jgi:hypothetical protein